MSSKKQLQAAGYSIASNILVQIVSRGFTFVIGAVTLKYLQSSTLLGIINVRLALLYTTLQFLSREPFRRACIGTVAKREAKNWYKIINTIWLGLPLCALISIPLIYVWRQNSPSQEDLTGTSLNDYYNAILIMSSAVMVEMAAEPCFIYAQARAIVDHNPKIEVLSVTLRGVLVALVTILESTKYQAGYSRHILTKVALCQLFTALISTISSYFLLWKRQNISPTKFIPRFLTVKGSSSNKFIHEQLDEQSLKLSISFVSQTFLKQLLTDGERYVMTFFNVISLSDQGIYDVVNNLGSLAARLLFKPVEDSGYTLFSQTVSRTELLDIRKFYRVQENLLLLIKSMLLLGLVVLTFGYNFVPLIVLYGGEKLNNPTAFHLMKWQLFYTPILAVNGITESFTFALMSSTEIRTYNLYLVLFSVMFLTVIYMTQAALGSACFIFANCVIMMSRILLSFQTISRFFTEHGYQLHLMDTLPSLTTLISMSGVFIFLSTSQHYLLDLQQPLSLAFGLILGFWCLLFMIHVVMCHEEALLNFVSRLFKIKLK